MIRGAALIATGILVLAFFAPGYETVGHPIATVFGVVVLVGCPIAIALGLYMLVVERKHSS